MNYLINVYSITFWGLYYWLVHSFLMFFECIIDNVCSCLSFELAMIKVMPYDPSREEAYNAFIMKTETEPKTVVFFLQNQPKPTNRKHFETVTTLFLCDLGSLSVLACFSRDVLKHRMITWPRSKYCWHSSIWISFCRFDFVVSHEISKCNAGGRCAFIECLFLCAAVTWSDKDLGCTVWRQGQADTDRPAQTHWNGNANSCLLTAF